MKVIETAGRSARVMNKLEVKRENHWRKQLLLLNFSLHLVQEFGSSGERNSRNIVTTNTG